MKLKILNLLFFFRSKNQALEDEIIRLKRSVAEWEKRYRDKEQEYFSFKEKQRSTPEVKLQADINMLTLEKVNDFIYYFFVFF
jgi:centrosomal protein CEP120